MTAHEDNIELSVIVFAFDEAENVGAVLEELGDYLKQHEPRAEIVFVDDGSRDATSEVAEAALSGTAHAIVRHSENRGIGAAIKSGVLRARGDFVTFMPADGQIEPEAIGELRAQQRRSGADLVLSLYADRDDGTTRKLLSFGMRAMVRVIHGVRLESDGPYLFRRSAFHADALPPDSFFLNLEFPIRVLLSGARASQVTIRCRPRRAGHSKSAKARVVFQVAKELLAFRLRRALE
ncbi:MAG: glycosyltransferase family 2 protein [Myxococcales bacterium]|nr:glycosyltransferase family 2 protein [Myxococcales bacterium]